MSSSRMLQRTAPVAFLVLAMAATGRAQERRWTVADPSKQCGPGAVVIGSLGYSGIECSSCSFTIHADGKGRQWKFRAEPVIAGVKPGGPADGKLREGDVVVAIGGNLITTQEGGRLFGSATPGERVVLRVRRDGREFQVEITPVAECAEILAPAAPAPVAQPAMPVPPTAPAPVMVAEPVIAVPAPPMPPMHLGGRLGMSIECSDCSIKVPKDAQEGEGAPVWTFRTAPRIERVEVDGPAAKAGLRGGDELTHIDGVSLTSEDGGRRFGAVQPGDTVVLRYRRNAADADAVLVAAPQEWVVVAPKAAPVPIRKAEPVVTARAPILVEETTRFSGVLGETQVVVTGGPITVTRTETEIVIRSQDIVVRVRQVAPPPPKE